MKWVQKNNYAYFFFKLPIYVATHQDRRDTKICNNS